MTGRNQTSSPKLLMKGLAGGFSKLGRCSKYTTVPAQETPTHDLWLDNNGFEPEPLGPQDFANAESFTRSLINYRNWAVQHFNNERELVGLRLLPIRRLKFTVPRAAGTPDESTRTVEMAGEHTVGGVELFLGVCIEKPKSTGGRMASWFQVGDLVLFCLQKNAEKLMRACAANELTHRDLVHNVGLVHTAGAREEIAKGTFNRIKDTIPIAVLPPYEAVLRKVGIVRTQGWAGIPNDGAPISLSDVLTIRSDSLPHTEKAYSKDYSHKNYGVLTLTTATGTTGLARSSQ